MKRRTEQAGYVYRKNNWWMVRFRETVIENGELVRKQTARQVERVADEHKRCKRPPQAVIDKAETMLRPLNDGSEKPESVSTLGDFIEQVYFAHLEKQLRSRKHSHSAELLTGGFSASTLKGYRARWTSQLKKRCATFELRRFETADAQRVFDEIAKKNPHLHRTTLHHLKSLLSGIYKFAIQKKYLSGPNPIREVSIPPAPKGKATYAYPLEEITSMLLALPLKERAMLALAGFAGLRRAEIAGTRWEDYDGHDIHVARSVWEGYVNETKTPASEDSVPVIPALVRILDAYRLQLDSPRSGVMFPSEAGTPMNLNNVLNRVILPAINRCAVCRKSQPDHSDAGHDFVRDEARPRWRGWHAFRRGLASNLNELGVEDLTIQRILRHANVATTRKHYIKTRNPKVEAAMQMLESALPADFSLDRSPAQEDHKPN